MRAVRTLAVVGLIAIAGWTPTCAAERVDLLLVLAADISRSVDEVKFQLQRSGYAAAFSDSRVIEAIRSGPNGRIAVELVVEPSASTRDGSRIWPKPGGAERGLEPVTPVDRRR
jgi:hypothetical protein